MKHDIQNLRDKWDGIKLWCRINESLAIVLTMWATAIMITMVMVYNG